MPKYAFTYFKLRGRGEITRLLFAAAGQDYEYKEVTQEEWPKLKPTLLTGQIPCLEVDGKQMFQSMAIARYLAREFGMAGSSSMEQFQVDQVVDTLGDLFMEVVKPFFEKDETKKAEMYKKLNEETLPKFLKILTTLLESNGGGDGFFVGSKMTLADLSFHDVLTHFLQKDEKCLEKSPKLDALIKRIETQPNMAKYLKERPKTDI